MTEPIPTGEPFQLLMAVRSGEHGQGEGGGGDAQCQQRRDGMAGMGRALVWRPASVAKPLAAEGARQQELTAGNEQRNGVVHAGMIPDWPWRSRAWPDGDS